LKAVIFRVIIDEPDLSASSKAGGRNAGRPQKRFEHMELPFKGQHDRATFFRAVRLANRPAGRSNRLQWLVVAALGVVIFFSGQSYLETGVLGSADLIRLGFAVAILVIFLGWPYALSYIQAARLWKDPALQQTITGRVQERGITYTNVFPYRTVPWTGFARLRITSDLVALLTPGGVLSVFPRGFFRSEADWQAFRRLAQQKVIRAQ